MCIQYELELNRGWIVTLIGLQVLLSVLFICLLKVAYLPGNKAVEVAGGLVSVGFQSDFSLREAGRGERGYVTTDHSVRFLSLRIHLFVFKKL